MDVVLSCTQSLNNYRISNDAAILQIQQSMSTQFSSVTAQLSSVLAVANNALTLANKVMLPTCSICCSIDAFI